MKIIFDQKSCIGAGECEALSPEYWKVQNNGKSSLKGATLNPKTGMLELEIGETEAEKQRIVVGSCPANCIRLIK